MIAAATVTPTADSELGKHKRSLESDDSDDAIFLQPTESSVGDL
jgi:hypothetical protein